jgi:septum formation protein
LYLASRSQRRQELLRQLELEFRVLDVEVDEIWSPQETAHAYVERLAVAKALAGAQAVRETTQHAVLGADTSVVLDHEVFGKPADREHALDMLARLSGRCHEVYSAVAVALPEGRTPVRVNVSRVRFRPLTSADCEAYWATGEPLGKAGGYAIQGVAAAFIERLEGSYSGVMGLPLFETTELLARAGILIPARAAGCGPNPI